VSADDEQPELRVGFVDAAPRAPGDEPGGPFHHEVRIRLGAGDRCLEVGQPLQVVLL
jgi:hypothetical protein